MSHIRATIAAIAAACTLGTEGHAKQESQFSDLTPPSVGSAARMYSDGVNFLKKYDLSGDGKLSRQEIANAVSSPSTKGIDAVLATCFFQTGDEVQKSGEAKTLGKEDILRVTRSLQSIDFQSFPDLLQSLLKFHDQFSAVDRDRDGQVSILELAQDQVVDKFIKLAFPEIAKHDSRESGISTQDIVAHIRDAVLSVTSSYTAKETFDLIASFDSNGDHLVSRDELRSPRSEFGAIFKDVFSRFYGEFCSKNSTDRGQIAGADLFGHTPKNRDLSEAASISKRAKRFILSATAHRDPGDLSDKVTQGRIGNCFLISAINAVTQADPESLTGLVRNLKNGEFKVTFPGLSDTPFFCTKPTLAERAIFSLSTDADQLSGIIEKAYGLFLKRGESQAKFAILPQEYTGCGGHASKALEMLTGRSTEQLDCSRANRTKIESLLTQWCPNGEATIPICIFTKKPWHGLSLSSSKFETNHAWSVHGFSKENGGTVTIRNPYHNLTSGDSEISLDTLISKFSGVLFVPPKS